MSQSTLYRIASQCSASQKKSLTGLDNHTADGLAAFDTLKLLAEKLSLYDPTFEVKQRLDESCFYLKAELRRHLSLSSENIDHCVQYALSDKDPDFQSKCKDHTHRYQCPKCQLIRELPHTFSTQLESVKDSMPETLYKELKYDIDQACDDINRWHAHVIRSYQQNKAKHDCMNAMDEKSGLLIMDFVMKWLPMRMRETMRDFYAKKGISWHCSVLVQKIDGQFHINCFYTVLESGLQDWYSVACIMKHVMNTVKAKRKKLKTLHLKADNAGCYHNQPFIHAIPTISKLTGVNIKRLDFSEAQDGKDLCDRRTAPVKIHVTRFCHAGNDVINADQLCEAIHSFNGVKGSCASVVNTMPIDGNKPEGEEWKGINSWNNFEFRGYQLRYWKQYNIGKGKQIRVKRQTNKYDLQIIRDFPKFNFECGNVRVQGRSVNAAENEEADATPGPSTDRDTREDQNENGNVWHCLEPGCSKVYANQANRERHMLKGNHNNYDNRDCFNDKIRKLWVQQNEVVRTEQTVEVNTTDQNQELEDSNLTKKGWAIRKNRTPHRKSNEVVEYLTNLFQNGEITKIKADPVRVSQAMRTMFPSEEWLTSRQIASFFSRLAAKKALGQSDSDDEDIEAVEEELATQAILLGI